MSGIKEFYTIKYGTEEPRLCREDSELRKMRFQTNSRDKGSRISMLWERGSEGGVGRFSCSDSGGAVWMIGDEGQRKLCRALIYVCSPL